MANLASSLTIMVAVGVGATDVAVRMLFAALLNVAVYLTNDIYDIDADLASEHKDRAKAVFLAAHRREARMAQAVPVAIMAALGAAWSPGLLVTIAFAALVCWAYSAKLKHVAFVDVPTIALCGIAGSMVAFPLDRSLGWTLAGQLGLFAACFQTVQMVRDHDDDASFGTVTTAVRLGVRRAVVLQRVLLTSSAVYAMLFIHRWIGVAMLLAPLLPLRAGEADRHWNRIRGVLGLAWLAIIAWIVWRGATYGLLVSLSRDAVFALPFGLR